MRFAQAFKSGRRNALGKTQKSRLHVGLKGGDLCGDGLVEDFDAPRHSRACISFLR
jgi:hypothetical protein